MALQLKRYGISNVYPMTGGIEAWLESGLPTDDADLP
ncbi:MAG: rhodanese-like domain-containing protein [Pseudomonadales bacterium]